MASVVKTAPATEPLTLAEAKLHLKQDEIADDALITSLIVAAREQCESKTQRKFITQTWTSYWDNFPTRFVLPFAPTISITSIKYLDEDGNEQTLNADQYELDPAREPGLIQKKYEVTWPDTRTIQNAVYIEAIYGYGAAAAVPDSIKAAMKLLIGHWYENREEVVTGIIATPIPVTADRLLFPYKLHEYAWGFGL